MSKKTVTVKINHREYHFACDSSEEVGLRTSAEYLNNKMTEIKGDAKGVMGAERLSILAALQITRELVDKQQQEQVQDEVSKRLKKICEKVEKAIAESKT